MVKEQVAASARMRPVRRMRTERPWLTANYPAPGGPGDALFDVPNRFHSIHCLDPTFCEYHS